MLTILWWFQRQGRDGREGNDLVCIKRTAMLSGRRPSWRSTRQEAGLPIRKLPSASRTEHETVPFQ